MAQSEEQKGSTGMNNLYYNYLCNELENGYNVVTIWIQRGVSNAFDTLYRLVLLKEFPAIGIHGKYLFWLKYYIDNGMQIIVIGEIKFWK